MTAAVDEFVRRAEAGSRNAFRPLVEAVEGDAGGVAEVAALLGAERVLVAGGAARVLGAVAAERPELVVPHAEALVVVARSPDLWAREGALEALAVLAARVPAALAPGVDALVEAFREERRSAPRATAALCLARAGLAPELRPKVLPAFVEHFRRNPRDKQARDVLVAMAELASAEDLVEAEREQLAGAVAGLRAHPNVQVRERAGRLWRDLGLHR